MVRLMVVDVVSYWCHSRGLVIHVFLPLSFVVVADRAAARERTPAFGDAAHRIVGWIHAGMCVWVSPPPVPFPCEI